MNEATEEEPSIKIDESSRLKGKVANYNKRRGFGYLIPDGADADDKSVRVFVHWKQLQSDSNWPSLEEGQEVSYYLGEQLKGKQQGKNIACNVSNADGSSIVANTGRDYLNKAERFKGTVKYWNQEKGFGWIKIEADITCGGEEFSAAKDIYVPIDEISTDDEPPALKLKDEVEFTLYKGKKGNGAGNVTLPGGGKYSFPKEDRPKMNKGFGPMKGMMGIQFINGMPYALVPKGGGNWGGGGNRWGGGGGNWGGGGQRRKPREQGQEECDGSQPSPGQLSEGQEVRAKWKNKWYSGKVDSLNADGTAKIFWSKFKNFSDSVSLDDIRVGASAPAEAMDTGKSSGGSVHKW